MKRNLKRHLLEEDAIGFKYPQWQVMKLKELKRYQRQNKEIIGSNTKGFSEEVARYLKNELEEGSYNVLKQYKEAMGDKYKANKRLNNSFFKINDKKVNSLIKSVNNDLLNANNAILRMTNDQYRQVIFKSEFYRANGVLTTKQAIDMANRDFLRRGLNVVEYKDGIWQFFHRDKYYIFDFKGWPNIRKRISDMIFIQYHNNYCDTKKVKNKNYYKNYFKRNRIKIEFIKNNKSIIKKFEPSFILKLKMIISCSQFKHQKYHLDNVWKRDLWDTYMIIKTNKKTKK
jgi:hypothetical protein